MVRYDEKQKLKDAKQIAFDNGCFVVTIGNNDKFCLYRRQEPCNILIGYRRSVTGLLSFVKKVCNFK